MSSVRVRWFGMLTLVVGLLLALGVFVIPGPVATAQEKPKEICDNKIDDDKDTLVDCEDPDCPPCEPKKEICDNNIDDDGDTFIDCKDPDCKCEPPKEGTPCSPGYWKARSHRAEFDATCVLVSGWTCEELMEALTCKGSDADCRRHEASEALNAINDCTE